MKTCEKGVSAVVAAMFVIVLAMAAVGGYIVLTKSDGSESSGSTGENYGSATVVVGGAEWDYGFDFSTGLTGDPNAPVDMGVEPYDYYGTPTSGATPSLRGYSYNENLVQDMGAVDLASITTAPRLGYTTELHVQAGHVYVIKCREGTHAKIRITSVTFTDNEYPATIVFDWAYPLA